MQAWQRPETVIVHEIFWTPTARYADIVLPATTTLERNDIASSSDRYMFAMHQAIEPVGEARNDFDIFADLAGRLGFRDDFTEGRSEMEWLRHLYEIVRQQAARHGIERPDFETFWEQGYIADPVHEALRYPRPAIAPIRDGKKLQDAVRARSRSSPRRSRRSAMTTAPAIRSGSSPPNGSARRKADRKLHLISNQPTMRLHGQLDNGPVSRASKVQGREPMLDQSAGCGRARHRRRRRGAACSTSAAPASPARW